MTKLSVNINKLATLRNSRGGNNPDLIQSAKDIERFGADGITVHPRPDERHIRYADVYQPPGEALGYIPVCKPAIATEPAGTCVRGEGRRGVFRAACNKPRYG